MTKRTLRRGAWLLCVGLIAALASGATQSIAASLTAANTKLTQAAAAAKLGQKRPTSIDITTPLKRKPPRGKTIVNLVCSQPVCQGFKIGLNAAARALGWKITYLAYQPTPAATLAAVQAAIQMRPSGIFVTGLDRAAIASALPAATAAHIPLVTGYSVDAPSTPVIANIADGPVNHLAPRLAADWVASNGGCKADVAVFTIKLYPILVATTNVFEPQLSRLCPNSTIKEFDVAATDVGTKVPTDVVSAIQSDPNIKYVAVAFGDMATGVAAALKAAGLTAKIVGYGAASPNNLQEVCTGNEAAETGYSIPYGGWRALDAFARYFEGMSPTVDTTSTNPGELFTKTNACASGGGWSFASAANYQSQFKKLWHVG